MVVISLEAEAEKWVTLMRLIYWKFSQSNDCENQLLTILLLVLQEKHTVLLAAALKSFVGCRVVEKDPD